MKIKNIKGDIVFNSTECFVSKAIIEMAEINKEANVNSTPDIQVDSETLRSFNIDRYGLPDIHFNHCLLATSRPNYVDMTRAIIEKCKIEQCNLSTVKLEGALIDGCGVKQSSFGDLSGSRLDGSTFNNCQFAAANLEDAEIIDNSFSKGTSFSYANLKGARLVGTFDHCDFTHSDLRGADLSEAQLTCCDLSDSKVSFETRFKSDPQQSGCKVENTSLMNKTLHVHVNRVAKL